MTTSGRDTRHDSALAVLVWTELGNTLPAAARVSRGILLHALFGFGRGLSKGLAVAVIAMWFVGGFSIILIVSFVLAMLRSTMSSARSRATY
jgi:hypothetical protein